MLHFSKHRIFLLILMVLFGTGCQSVSQIIEEKSRSTKNDIFIEMNNESETSAGYVVLNLQLSLNTFEPNKDMSQGIASGDRDYSIFLNIDGQSVKWKANQQIESTRNSDEESGKFMKYSLLKKIRLNKGKHTVFLAIPANEYTLEFNVKLSAKEHTLAFVPRYNRQTRKWGEETILAGFKKFDVYLDDEKIVGQGNRNQYNSRPGRRSPL